MINRLKVGSAETTACLPNKLQENILPYLPKSRVLQFQTEEFFSTLPRTWLHTDTIQGLRCSEPSGLIWNSAKSTQFGAVLNMVKLVQSDWVEKWNYWDFKNTQQNAGTVGRNLTKKLEKTIFLWNSDKLQIFKYFWEIYQVLVFWERVRSFIE